VTTPSWHDITLWSGAIIAVAFAALDLWHFHALSSQVDLMFLVGGLGALGLNLAYNAGTTNAARR
jgi:hypothetical protein